ncbi:hypothetical protein Aca07nite_51440 [Actinoplanes capillaceus]|uniref:Uncharacterized protein n=1 Tax=Actinoplanes campanulatus TaxID=113559 RepID=A0ABQ3WNN7_9ACTN|nr:hypothetical protein Aca07nite_51440 [Actinoplanes capillaceus]
MPIGGAGFVERNQGLSAGAATGGRGLPGQSRLPSLPPVATSNVDFHLYPVGITGTGLPRTVGSRGWGGFARRVLCVRLPRLLPRGTVTRGRSCAPGRAGRGGAGRDGRRS